MPYPIPGTVWATVAEIHALGVAVDVVAAQAPTQPLVIPISASAWTAAETAADAQTRHITVEANIPEQVGYEIGVYRGSNPAGVLSSLGVMAWTGTRYTWTSAGVVTPGGTNYQRLGRRATGATEWAEWITAPADNKPVQVSGLPAAPSWTWGSPTNGTIRVTFSDLVGNGRAITGGKYQIGSGAWVAFAGTEPLDIAGFTDGQETGLTIRMTNANGDGPVSSRNVTSAAAIVPPAAPDLSYTINGTGTSATLALTGGADDIVTVRYRIGAGAYVVRSAIDLLDLTGLSATQDISVSWANSAGYSPEQTITVVASPPTYAAGSFAVTNAAAETGDALNLAISAHPAAPAGLTRTGTQWSADGTTWRNVSGATISGAGLTPGQAAAIRLRAVYDVGPSVASPAVTATPDYPVAVTAFGVMSEPKFAARGSANTNHPAAMATHAAGNLLDAFIIFKDVPASVAASAGWSAPVRVSDAAQTGHSIWRTSKTAMSAGETLAFTTDPAVQSVVCTLAFDGVRESQIGITAHAEASSTALNVANMAFAKAEKAIFLLFYGQLGSSTVQSGPPAASGEDTSGIAWSSLQTYFSATNSNGVRLTYATKQAEVASLNPAAWPDARQQTTSFMVAYLPVASVPPVTAVSVAVSPQTVLQGDTVRWVVTADGRAPRTYSLTVDGHTYTNSTGIFEVTPSYTASAWSVTVSNASGSRTTTGTITVAQNMAFTVSETSVYTATFDAASVPHTVTPVRFEMEIQTAEGAAITVLSQTGASFTYSFAGNGAYRLRPIAIDAGGARSTGEWCFYAPFVQSDSMETGQISWVFQGARQIQATPLMAQGPIEIVPVTGRKVRTLHPRPNTRTEHGLLRKAVATDPDVYSDFLIHGAAVNPNPLAGRGPQFWDQRKGGSDGLLVGKPDDYFSNAQVVTYWPVYVGVDDTISKARSRPMARLRAGDQGYRGGLIDQHAGVVVMNALSTSSPMQMCPAIFKTPDWVGGPITLSGWNNLLDQITARRLSVAGLPSYNLTTIYNQLTRFDPAVMLMRGGTYYNDSPEPFIPFNMGPPWEDGNYYDYELMELASCYLVSDAVNNDWKRDVAGAMVINGKNRDFRGNKMRVSAGVNQRLVTYLALSRLAQGLDFLDLNIDQFENVPIQYDYWTSTTLAYLQPHNSNERPLFSLRRQIAQVLPNSATGHEFTIPWGNLLGETKQRFDGLYLVRESTGESLPVAEKYNTDQSKVYPDLDRSTTNSFTGLATVGFFSTPLVAGETIYMKIPDAAIGGFVAGQPFWAYGVGAIDGGGLGEVNWRLFNPTPGAAYREINRPHGKMMLLTALSAWPNIAGSRWNACREYTIRTYQPNWPSAALAYSPTARTFVSGFWRAHSATLGLTL